MPGFRARAAAVPATTSGASSAAVKAAMARAASGRVDKEPISGLSRSGINRPAAPYLAPRGGPFRSMRRGLLIASAALSAAIAISGIYVVAHYDPAGQDSANQGSANQGSAGTGTGPASESPHAGTHPASALLVHDGDTVEATGRVIAAPNAPVKFCAPAPQAIAAGDGPPDCLFWVEARGVDLDALADRSVIDGVVVGMATLRGTWQSRVLTVTSQPPPATSSTMVVPSERRLPCDPPPGGWQRTSEVGGGPALRDYLAQHSDQFAEPWIAWPEGTPGPNTAAPDFFTKPAVFVIEVVSGDVDQARAELSRVYAGNLCVVRAEPEVRSSAEVNRNRAALADRVLPLMNERRNGIYSAGDDPSGRYHVDFVVLDQQLLDAFTRIGLDVLILNPWIRPAA
jgi:hypothetical protein